MMGDKALLFDTHAHVLSADLVRYPYSTLRGGANNYEPVDRCERIEAEEFND